MKNELSNKISILSKLITSDERWDLNNELMVQVYAFTVYGYSLGVGYMVLSIDYDEINKIIIKHLTELGLGNKYASGLIENAYLIFQKNNEKSIHYQLITIGQSYFSHSNLIELKESIFSNTKILTK